MDEVDTCEFQQYDLEGNVVYRCDNPHYDLKFMDHTKQFIKRCEAHWFWADSK